MEEMNWVIELNNELKNRVDTSKDTEEYWKSRSIYKVPACIKELNRKAYIPQVVSFGPYHHGEERLKPMEEHKHRALHHFINRCGRPIQDLVNAMDKGLQDLKDSYEPLDLVWKNDKHRFLQLMILDGCFMLEILRGSTIDYASNDPIFSKHGKILYIMPLIKRDMLMLENQLPMRVLDELDAIHHSNKPMVNSFYWPHFPRTLICIKK